MHAVIQNKFNIKKKEEEKKSKKRDGEGSLCGVFSCSVATTLNNDSGAALLFQNFREFSFFKHRHFTAGNFKFTNHALSFLKTSFSFHNGGADYAYPPAADPAFTASERSD